MVCKKWPGIVLKCAFGTTFLLIFKKQIPPYIFIQYYFFINFQEYLPPTLLFGTTFLSISRQSSLLHSYSGLLLYSELYYQFIFMFWYDYKFVNKQITKIFRSANDMQVPTYKFCYILNKLTAATRNPKDSRKLL